MILFKFNLHIVEQLQLLQSFSSGFVADWSVRFRSFSQEDAPARQVWASDDGDRRPSNVLRCRTISLASGFHLVWSLIHVLSAVQCVEILPRNENVGLFVFCFVRHLTQSTEQIVTKPFLQTKRMVIIEIETAHWHDDDDDDSTPWDWVRGEPGVVGGHAVKDDNGPRPYCFHLCMICDN